MIHWCLWLLMLLLLASNISHSQASRKSENKIKSAVFLSPKLPFRPGSVLNKYYYNIGFPKGHIAIKSFNGELVDEALNPVPLHETYLHHWVVERYYQRKESDNLNNTRIQLMSNGLCQDTILRQYFGLGSETRKTATHIPDPYGIEVGNPVKIPDGYEEIWMLNIHGIDTRGVENRLGCTECWCDLYNVTPYLNGQPLGPDDYKGGLLCCSDGKQCRLRQEFKGAKRNLYLRYTVKWVDWDSNIIPVDIYVFDVTDTEERLNTSGVISLQHNCQIEYDAGSCNATGVARNRCIVGIRTSLSIPTDGYLIYGVGHQHVGGVGITLYGKHGRVLCPSVPAYGKGKEAGNEAGYIVGMSTCYPKPGSLKITGGETLVLESNYNGTRNHIGVMGLFYILVADRIA
ncbi:hypothetical protein HS088_TW08G00224 [Tripterygium wilfordii]|uniref:Stress up-regulated Nod 19 n=1 Tax=Tripterygium wilfordii TaxID=458696 RepID=A0A7J7DBJ7_TRIWF|nr:uncharacterized protein LOC120003787 [Tripterygium wilfordii]KAF5743639.1 hypothetical protein HS088_TW08G00224 [Tripterygium wilfordii]